MTIPLTETAATAPTTASSDPRADRRPAVVSDGVRRVRPSETESIHEGTQLAPIAAMPSTTETLDRVAIPPSHDHRDVVAIDGPAAAGKSTVARALADRLGAMLFDTGTLYRAVTLAALRNDVSFDDGEALAALAHERHIDVAPPSAPDGRLYDVLLDGDDVTWPIRSPIVESGVSQVAAHAAVRRALLPTQRRIAGAGPVVMVGRDIGTVVVPDAGVKVFLEASLAERARRRFEELADRGGTLPLDAVVADLERRDAIDRGRAASPLQAAADAVVVQTDHATVDDVVNRIERIVYNARAARA